MILRRKVFGNQYLFKNMFSKYSKKAKEDECLLLEIESVKFEVK